ncbi:MAG: hypothetical protein FWB71_05145 [Defluviitaleaceae bacterium]|nr:hypothetical protein [Defluviitaleaceae bacterium]
MIKTQSNPDAFAKHQQPAHSEHIYSELQKSKALLDNPNVELVPHNEVMAKLRQRQQARNHV